jgi:hypothetical protein
MDPQRYLQYVLERIADHPINRMKNCWPGTWSTKSISPQGSLRRWRPEDELP